MKNTRFTLVSLVLLFAFISVAFAAGGGGAEEPEEDIIRITLVPTVAKDHQYGWVRIDEEVLILGINGVDKESDYGAFFESPDGSWPIGEEPFFRSNRRGVGKFRYEILEPLSSFYERIAVYEFPDGLENPDSKVLLMEGALP